MCLIMIVHIPSDESNRYYGNFGMNVRAYTYIRSMGPDGLKAVTEYAVLNANYMMRRLAPYYDLPL